MRGISTYVLPLVALVALACFASPATAQPPADWMYEPTTFTEVQLTLPPTSVQELEAEPKEYVRGTFSLAETDGTPGAVGPFSTPIEVGIELKGSVGSLRKLSEKAAFKVRFDKFVEGQSFEGLEKMTFNNMVQDPSMIHETTTYQAFHDMGLEAPNTGYTYLTVNGKSYGLHLNLETQDAQSLQNAFGTPFTSPPQHLYEGEEGADVSNEPWHGTAKKKWEALEVSEGKKKEKGDLIALVGAVEGSGSFAQRVQGFADLNEMTREWLVEKYVGHWDGYSGIAPTESQPNNYYLYSNTAGEFQMLPWGTDQTWQENRHLNFETGGGKLFSDCIADTSGCRQTYLAAGNLALSKLNAQGLDTVARCTAAAIKPWREYEVEIGESEKLPPYTPQETEEETAVVRSFIAARPAELASFLGVAAPPAEPGEPPCPPLRPIGGFPVPSGETGTGGPSAAGSPGPAKSSPTSGALGRLRLNRSHRALVIHTVAPGTGRVVVTGSIGSGAAAKIACRGHAAVGAAGPATVRCRLNRWLLHALRQGPLRVAIRADFIPPGTTSAASVSSASVRLGGT